MEQVHSWLISQHVHVPKDWLTACLEWLQAENQNRNLPSQNMKQQVMEQWLLTDLQELGVERLPRRVIDGKYTLNGMFCLQINLIVDVSKPLYGQLLEIQNRDNPNSRVSAETQVTQKPWEAKPTRMLKMVLTDGVNEVHGMEYRNIPCLNDKLPPGTKIKIKGPVVCRNGMLMLTQNNVQVLGGEVEDLVERNSKEANLCRVFNQQPVPRSTVQAPSAQNHQNLELPDDVINQLVEESLDSGFETATSHPSPRRNTQHNSAVLSDEFGDDLTDDDILMEMQRIEAQQTSKPTAASKPVKSEPIRAGPTGQATDTTKRNVGRAHNHDNVTANDCQIISVSQRGAQSKKRQKTKPSKQVSIEDAFKQNFKPLSENLAKYANADIGSGASTDKAHSAAKSREAAPIRVKREIKQEADVSCPSLVARIKGPLNNACPPMTPPDACDMMEDDELCELANLVEAEAQATPLKYFCQLRSSDKVPQRLSTKAFIVTLLSKLSADSVKGWNLKAKICDGTGTIDAQFSNAVLTQLIGFEARQMEAIKRQGDADDLDRLRRGMRACRDTIIGLCKIMEVEVNERGATVTALVDADDDYWSSLERTTSRV